MNGATLTVTFDGALDEESVPAAGAFTVKATRAGTERTVALAATGAVDVSGSTVTLALAEPVLAIDTVTVAYAKPATDPLRDADNAKLPVTGFDGTARATNATPPDVTAPRGVSQSANGATVTLTYDEALDESVSLNLASFGLDINDTVAETHAASASVSGRTVTLTFGTAARHGDSVRIRYVRQGADSRGGSGTCRATKAAFLPSRGQQHPSGVSSASVNGATLTVTFDGALDEESVPAAGAFTVKATRAGVERTVALAATGAVDVSGSTVTLALAEPVVVVDTVTVAYAEPATNPLRDSDNAKLPVTGFDGTRRSPTPRRSRTCSRAARWSPTSVNGPTRHRLPPSPHGRRGSRPPRVWMVPS